MGRRWAASAVPTFLSAAAFTCAASLMIFAQALTWELPGDGAAVACQHQRVASPSFRAIEVLLLEVGPVRSASEAPCRPLRGATGGRA